MTGDATPQVDGLSVGEVLPDLRIPALPEGSVARGLVAFIQLQEPDGSVGWSARVTSGLGEEEVLGLLTGYVEHLRAEAAAAWSDLGPTSPTPSSGGGPPLDQSMTSANPQRESP